MSKMQTNRRARAKAARLQIVSQLYLRHEYSYDKIRKEVMEKLNLRSYSKSTVKSDVDTAKELLNDRIATNMEEARSLELIRIDDACAESWESYEQSKKRNNGLGDVRYLAEIRQQLQERRKLLGLYAPEKKEVAGGISFAALLMESNVIEDNK